MIQFVEKPSLPAGRVKTIIGGNYCEELKAYFREINIDIIEVSQNNNIDTATSTHTDMLAIHLGGNSVVVDCSQTDLINKLTDIGVNVLITDSPVKGDYPDDIKLNFTIIGDRVIGNIKHCDIKISEELKNLNFYNCKQGYCKCSCLVINENALITDDESIFNVASSSGIDCLKISKGDISLPGHEYGFIGGASGKISQGEVLFFGDITAHRDYKKIADFIKKHGCVIKTLNFPLTDFGGLVPLVEEIF